MDLTDAQLQSIADQVAERIQPRLVPAYAAGQPAMVQLPPEFYQSQREIAERVARLEERFEAVDKRFEQVDKRFDDLIHYVDKRFDAVDKRLSFQQWLIGVGFLVLTTLMTVYQFLA
jgi:DNA-binding ferritin-like protein